MYMQAPTSSPAILPAFPASDSLSDLRAEGISGQTVKCRYCGRRYPSSSDGCPCSQDTLVLANPMVGRVLGGRYRFDEHLGGAIFHGVYRAAQLVGDRDVVVRLMPRGMGASAAEAAHVHHAGLPRVIEVGRGDRYDFLVVDFVRGLSVDELIRKRTAMSAPLVARIAVQLLSAISAAHAMGIAHGRLHPRNVLVTPGGRVYVLDLGAGPRDVDELQPGERERTLSYNPPEQRWRNLEGERPRTASSDVWAASRMCLEILRGGRLSARHPGFDRFGPTSLTSVFQRGLAKDERLRFHNARSLLEEIVPWALDGGLVR